MPDPSRGLIELERALGPSTVVTDAEHCMRFARDESEAEPTQPLAVVHARSVRDVSTALTLCNTHGIPVFPRAAGTGRTGGATCTAPGVVLDTTKLTQVREIDRENLIAVVEPGVVLGPFQQSVEREGLFYPPDPASLEWCTLGGNAAENAGGPRAFRYGVTREYVLGMECVTMDGTVMNVGKRTVKGVTGYDLTALLVGSEGTLAVFTSLTLRLIPKPAETVTVLARFPHARDAARAVSSIVAAGLVPQCLELLDKECCDAIRDAGSTLVGDARTGAVLITELDGEGPSLERALARVGELCANAHALGVEPARDEAERERLWGVRRSMSRALRARARFKMSEDVVVPRSRLAEMYERIHAIAEQNAIVMPAYGHAGDGNLHVNLLWNDPDGKPRVERAIEALFRATIALGGTLTGEHGLGVLKAPWLALEQSDAVIDLQRRIKTTFDPRGLLNPGKMFPRGSHGLC